MTPIVNGLETEYADRIVFQKLDADTLEGHQVMETYHLRGHPAIVLFDANGDVAWTSLGVQPRETIVAAIEQIINP